MISLALTVVSALTLATTAGQTQDPLLFPKDNFTVETKTVKTSAGEKKVTYRSYMHIPYVAKPIDKDYQSMNVSVPVKVDDTAVNATMHLFFLLLVSEVICQLIMRASVQVTLRVEARVVPADNEVLGDPVVKVGKVEHLECL